MHNQLTLSISLSRFIIFHRWSIDLCEKQTFDPVEILHPYKNYYVA